MIGTALIILLVITTVVLIFVIFIAIGVFKSMATLEEIKVTEGQQLEKINKISTDLTEVSRKVDILIVQGAGGGASDQVAINDIAQAQEQVNVQILDVAATVKTLGETVDSHLGPHVEPHR